MVGLLPCLKVSKTFEVNISREARKEKQKVTTGMNGNERKKKEGATEMKLEATERAEFGSELCPPFLRKKKKGKAHKSTYEL